MIFSSVHQKIKQIIPVENSGCFAVVVDAVADWYYAAVVVDESSFVANVPPGHKSALLFVFVVVAVELLG